MRISDWSSDVCSSDLTRGSLDESSAYKWRAVGSVAWRYNNLRIRYKAEYFSPILDSRERLLDYRELLQDLPNAEEPLYLRYPAVWEHSISATYDLDLGGTEIRLKDRKSTRLNSSH